MTTGAPLDLLTELNRLEALRQPAQHEDRQFRRFRIRGDAELHPIDASRVDRTPVDIKLRDLGQGGIGFICEHDLAVGSTWRCCFLNEGHVIAQQALLIRHCRPVQSGLYLLGAQFCLDTGIMTLLGVNAHALNAQQDNDNTADSEDFLSPGDVDAEEW